MRQIKLTGRETTVVRAIGFTESMLGAEIQDFTRMESEDVTDTLNSLMGAGFVESIPYYEQVQLAEMPVTAFEVNPAYAHELRQALSRHY
jgi:negative regulator of sigma E activity